MARVIVRERIKPRDPRLGRNIHFDSFSLRYLFDTSGLDLVSKKHQRRITILDQGNLGSCTGNAAIGCRATDPYYDLIPKNSKYTSDEAGAVKLYSDLTKADSYPGAYPPDDTGSDGTTAGNVLLASGEISGFQTVITLGDALKALTVRPFITGTYWYSRMFNPDPDGRVHPEGRVEGGHEYVADEIKVELEQIWFTNSWGASWSRLGRFYMTFDDYGKLLAQQGDVTIFVPRSLPPPHPTPEPDADFAKIIKANDWVNKHHVGDNGKVAKAARTWLSMKGL